jgi:hypothetical protein
MLDGSSPFTIEGLEIGDGHRWHQSVVGQTNQPCFWFCSNSRRCHAGDDKVCSAVASAKIGSTALVCPTFWPDHEGMWVAFLGSDLGPFLSVSLKNVGRRRIGCSAAAIPPMPVLFALRGPCQGKVGSKWAPIGTRAGSKSSPPPAGLRVMELDGRSAQSL